MSSRSPTRAVMNDLPVVFLEGDLYAGVREEFACVCFNAPLVRAPLVTEDAPLYLRSPRGESLQVALLECVGRSC